MSNAPRTTHVVGGGIVGMACATRLQEAGHEVVVIARDAPEDTTSSVAAAVWYPYLAEPRERILGWSARTFEVLRTLCDEPDAAVRMRTAVELFTRTVPDPWWAAALGEVGRLARETLPAGFADAYEVRVPVVESLRHLRWLERRFVERGGRVERRALDARSWEVLAAGEGLVVQCTGLGAAELTGDRELYPVRGQVVRVQNPGVERCTIADEGPHGIAYVIPRERDVILGGTVDEDARDLTPDPAETRRILRAAVALEPRLAGAEVLDVRVGLRPCRSHVRLERDERGVVHCYGHGGSGFTLAWGCADEIVRLAAGGRAG